MSQDKNRHLYSIIIQCQPIKSSRKRVAQFIIPINIQRLHIYTQKPLQTLTWKRWSGKSVGSAYKHTPAFHSMRVPPVTGRLYRRRERGGRGNGAAADGSETEGVVGSGTLPFSEALRLLSAFQQIIQMEPLRVTPQPSQCSSLNGSNMLCPSLLCVSLLLSCVLHVQSHCMLRWCDVLHPNRSYC